MQVPNRHLPPSGEQREVPVTELLRKLCDGLGSYSLESSEQARFTTLRLTHDLREEAEA